MSGRRTLYSFDLSLLALGKRTPIPAIRAAIPLGNSVAGVGSDVLIGAPGALSAYLYSTSSNTPLQTYTDPSGFTFGQSVGAVGSDVLVGDTGAGANGGGQVYLFTTSSSTIQQTFDDPNNTSGDNFGSSVAGVGSDANVGADGYNGGNDVGQAYIFTTSSTSSPTVTSPTDTGITSTSATLGGDATSDGGATITTRGVVYALTSVNSNPTIGGSGVTELIDGSGGIGVFTENATGLTPGAGYSFAAFATNSVGTTYTSPVSTFTTLNFPTVTSPTDTSITGTSATWAATPPATAGGNDQHHSAVLFMP